MSSQGSLNCEKLRAVFEGREAIYLEKGVLRVRVTNIHCYDHQIFAEVEEVPTKGLEVFSVYSGRIERATPLRWKISAGYLTSFSDDSWEMGYGGWSLFFAPEVVSGLASIASDWPAELNAMERYEQALDFLYQRVSEPSKRVFPDYNPP